MLFTKTLCKAGALVFIVPSGLLVTLRYDAHGMLSKVYEGITDKTDLGESFLRALVRQGLVPSSIRLHGGTTDIQGVFYSNEVKAAEGELPYCEFDRIKEDIESGNPKYKFYVGNVESGAMPITAASLQSWTRMIGLETLPCWAVPANATDEMMKSFILNNTYINFEYPLIAGYFVYDGPSRAEFYRTFLDTYTVTNSPVTLIDFDGYIKYGLQFGEISKVIDYSDAVRFNINKGTQVVVDRDTGNVIWSNTQYSEATTRLPKRITCSSCHKIIDVPSGGPMTCSDPFCTSRLYPRIKRFCTILGLDMLSTEDFDKAIAKGKLTILPDLLLLTKYKNIKVTKPLSEIVLACIDGDIGISKDWIVKFCNKCNNSYDTLKYYFEGPRRIATDLDVVLPPRLASWLDEPRNLVELDTVIKSEQIEISNGDRITKFDGAPVLRDKRIMITGTFKHGTIEDIIAILQSYSATVVTQMDKKVQCVVVGDIKENIDGLAIQAAREFDIPMFDEHAFFDRYTIDEDLEKFLK